MAAVVSDTFEVDGRIALADLPGADIGDRDAHERRRQGRLDDVMIVLERDAPAIEQALLARLRGMDLAGAETAVRLTVDDRAPRFAVSIRSGGGGSEAAALHSRAGAIADEVEQELLGAIARWTSAARHFSPEVEAHPKGDWPENGAPLAPAAPTSRPAVTQAAAPQPVTGVPEAARPEVFAARRPRRARATIWLQVLFFLLAAVLFATLYLYLAQPR